jgi:DNA-binding transcriptional ArsR family regulator
MEHPLPSLAARAELLRTLAHPARLHILELLRDGEACVCHIQAVLDQRQGTVSQHLMVLRAAHLVRTRKQGLRVYYALTHPQVLAALDGLQPWVLSSSRSSSPRHVARLRLTPSRGRCPCPRCAGHSA